MSDLVEPQPLPSDVRIDGFCSGQRDTRYRLTHMPTGIVVQDSRDPAEKPLGLTTLMNQVRDRVLKETP